MHNGLASWVFLFDLIFLPGSIFLLGVQGTSDQCFFFSSFFFFFFRISRRSISVYRQVIIEYALGYSYRGYCTKINEYFASYYSMNSISHIVQLTASGSLEKVQVLQDFSPRPAGSGGAPFDDGGSAPLARSVPPKPLPSSLGPVSPKSESLSTVSFSCRTSSTSFA